MPRQTGAALLFLAALAAAQQPGPLTPEVHPKITTERCTKDGGCKTANTFIVLDSNYRWLHNVNGYNNCVTQGFDKALCPDIETCAKNCALEGVDYASYGIATQGDALTLNLYVNKSGVVSLTSPRVYLLDEDEKSYVPFRLLNQEFSFDVDVTKVPCGINGALYFSEMELTGDASELNKAGAAYGTGYCDAQCPSQNFINGKANLNGTYGACCSEMDIWEANNAATAFTPHPCNITGVYACTEPLCGNKNRPDSVCDKDGCDYNAYRNGQKTAYSPGAGNDVDTSKPFTIVTQFLTEDNTPNTPLVEIRRLYVQDGKVIKNAPVNVPGLAAMDSITDEYCASSKKVFGARNNFGAQGGLKAQGEAFERGMVLAMSIWDDGGSNHMLWLDGTFPRDGDPSKPGVARGPCGPETGVPADNIKNYPDARVIFSKIRSGDIDSTY